MLRGAARIGHVSLVIAAVGLVYSISATLRLIYKVLLWPLAVLGVLDYVYLHSARLRGVFALHLGEAEAAIEGGGGARALAGALGCAVEEHVVETADGFLLALHLGRLKDDHKVRPEQISVGKLNNAREALAIARECRSILGGNGITLEYPVIRHMNNLESVFTYEGTNEMHTLVIGEALTGIAAYRG